MYSYIFNYIATYTAATFSYHIHRSEELFPLSIFQPVIFPPKNYTQVIFPPDLFLPRKLLLVIFTLELLPQIDSYQYICLFPMHGHSFRARRLKPVGKFVVGK